MLNREAVESILASDIRPMLRRDGGDIELLDVHDNKVYVRLTGACRGCPSAAMTLRLGVERLLREEFPEMDELVAK
ncbi:MAG: NifU family protein [Candidatus Eisenbacteria bacterium]|nr:NifU family protein [Candidatus Eisenbacteria bacterium]